MAKPRLIPLNPRIESNHSEQILHNLSSACVAFALLLTSLRARVQDALGRAIEPAEVMGGIVTGPSGANIVSAAAFVLKFSNQNNKPSADSDSEDGYVAAWERAAVNLVNVNFGSVGRFCFEPYSHLRSISPVNCVWLRIRSNHRHFFLRCFCFWIQTKSAASCNHQKAHAGNISKCELSECALEKSKLGIVAIMRNAFPSEDRVHTIREPSPIGP